AGGLVSSVTRSTWILGRLLQQGIGDTIRISITDDRIYEIEAARELLRTVGLESSGIRVVSCPRCGRSTFDSQKFLKQIQVRLLAIRHPVTVAIMGCQVNGPGEAAHADIAITGIGNKVFLYEKGTLVREVALEDAESALFDRLEAFINEQ
ncbi:MAG: flavodoxin-dependent (E)-4-hydroxy-3-methylbut-2-enyl-diphosphate synthase, partial [Sphaerochaetaceae bacterium]|nr:flavodoxin-dependent (E)-4-hydroxy-3-methylbut-2-enyl-diphosphate synthase [Sphaerochaetaceae bacterium]